MKENLIVELSIEFALSIIEIYSELIHQKEFVISRQLLKAGTGIGANVHDSIAAESRKDFVHKMQIAFKEAHETRYWLILLEKSELTDLEVSLLRTKNLKIIKVLSKIVKTTRFNLADAPS